MTRSAGTITPEDREFVETWEHISPQQWGIIRLDPRGDEKHEVIKGRRTFQITSEERIITEGRILDELNDPFLNGSFRPVLVPDSVTEQTNPNALSDEEILRILQTESAMAWRENLKVIDSVGTIKRMLEMAEEADISVRRLRELEAHLEETRGKVQLNYKDPALRSFLGRGRTTEPADPAAAANTVASGQANPRRQGGLSSDYR